MGTSHALILLLHGLLAGIAAGFVASLKSDPDVVVLMDTFAAGDVYDAEKLTEVLQDILPGHKLHFEALASDWSRETAVAAMRPRLVIINRSALSGSYNAEDKLGPINVFTRPTDDTTMISLDLQANHKLIGFMGLLGNEVARTDFLIYSRGADTNWLSDDFRDGWVKTIQERFPKLKGRRIGTMVIPNDYNGTFRDPKKVEELRRRVKKILDLPDDRQFSITFHNSMQNSVENRSENISSSVMLIPVHYKYLWAVSTMFWFNRRLNDPKWKYQTPTEMTDHGIYHRKPLVSVDFPF